MSAIVDRDQHRGRRRGSAGSRRGSAGSWLAAGHQLLVRRRDRQVVRSLSREVALVCGVHAELRVESAGEEDVVLSGDVLEVSRPATDSECEDIMGVRSMGVCVNPIA